MLGFDSTTLIVLLLSLESSVRGVCAGEVVSAAVVEEHVPRVSHWMACVKWKRTREKSHEKLRSDACTRDAFLERSRWLELLAVIRYGWERLQG